MVRFYHYTKYPGALRRGSQYSYCLKVFAARKQNFFSRASICCHAQLCQSIQTVQNMHSSSRDQPQFIHLCTPGNNPLFSTKLASRVAQTVKNLPAMQETWVQVLGREDPLEEEMATHSSILAWRIPWTEEPGGLQSMGSPRVGHNSETNTFTFQYKAGDPKRSVQWWVLKRRCVSS